MYSLEEAVKDRDAEDMWGMMSTKKDNLVIINDHSSWCHYWPCCKRATMSGWPNSRSFEDTIV